MVLEDLKKEHPDAISVVCQQRCTLLNSLVSRIMCHVILQITNDDPLKPLGQTSVATSTVTNEYSIRWAGTACCPYMMTTTPDPVTTLQVLAIENSSLVKVL
jgi:hypothetical protein